ncbi:MAG: ROK family protein [Elusimicrobiota bacterium]
MPERTAIGVDVGGTFTKLALVGSQGRLLERAQMPTAPEAGPADFVRRVGALVDAFKGRAGARAIGLGLAGDVDSRRGCLRFTPNLPGWEGFDFKKAFSRKMKRPVVVENDANAAVWGAYVTELKRRPRNVIGVTLGTGVGGGLILEGRLYRGSTGSAGEIGHALVEPGGELCHCGARGCLEAYAGNYGIVRTARRLLKKDPRRGALLRRLCPDLDALDPKTLTLAAERGDAVAREVWRLTGRRLGIGLANLVLVLNPDVLLLLGGVSRAGRWLLDPVRRSLSDQPFQTSFKAASVRMAGNHDGGCVGAALLALDGPGSR